MFSRATRTVFVDLVCAGVPLRDAAAAVGASAGSSASWWAQSGGMRLRPKRLGGLADPAPPGDEPKGRALTAVERGAIQAGMRQGLSCRAIGELIGRDGSVVWREVKRNSSPDGFYYASVAHTQAHQARRRPKTPKLARLEAAGLCARIAEWMDQGWSPKLIALMLARDHPGDETMRVSHETIYRALYVQARGSLRADLARKLATKRTARKPREGAAPRGAAAVFQDALRISQRPPEAADRAVPGHWEGDLIIGSGSTAIGTLVERSTRFVILLHLPDRHTADEVAKAMIAQMRELPAHLRRSITWDRGTELAGYADIQLQLQAPVYFADPHSPWQRGSNENTNRLLRFWFEKSTDLSVHTAEDLGRVAATLNARPRPTLGLNTPAQALNKLLTQAT